MNALKALCGNCLVGGIIISSVIIAIVLVWTQFFI